MPLHWGTTSQDADRSPAYYQAGGKEDPEVIREALHSRNTGGGRSQRQSTADNLQGRTEIQRPRGLTREEPPKDNGKDASKGTEVYEC